MREKISEFLLDVSKYVFTASIVAPLFIGEEQRTTFCTVGFSVSIIGLLLGLSLIKRKKVNTNNNQNRKNNRGGRNRNNRNKKGQAKEPEKELALSRFIKE